MTILEMAIQARQHWQSVNPKVYRLMEKNGDLIKESEAAGRLTQREMDTLMKGGMSEAEAWQASREIFIFSDPSNEYNP